MHYPLSVSYTHLDSLQDIINLAQNLDCYWIYPSVHNEDCLLYTSVILNGYYCGHLGEDMSLDELTAGVRYHYENSMNDLDGFIGAHDDRLPPEVIEEARAVAHAAGLPFSEKPYRDCLLYTSRCV